MHLKPALQWAGVSCAGNPHFWLNADGTYLEEGQKNIKGKIWGKVTPLNVRYEFSSTTCRLLQILLAKR
ncbi:hypothetical protein BHM03_00039951 [Ensete ventricosum]|nr:hypothetical protein BHM03_00039951 [Ensete ventricosum]